MAESFLRDEEMREDVRHIRPFYYLVFFALLLLYATTVYNTPSLQQPLPLLLFSVVMVAHAVLHWFSPTFVTFRGRLAGYVVVQLGLIVVMTYMSQSVTLNLGLSMSLAGELIGILEKWRRALIAAAGILLFMALNITLIDGWEVLFSWLGVALLMLGFVFFYVLMFVQQMNARAEAQRLLRELEAAHLQLAAYAQQVETLTLEAERQRMARELHDTLAQGLAGLVLQLEGLEAHLERGNTEKVAEIAAQAKGRARTTLAEARQAIGDLRERPQNVAAAIRREVARFEEATGIPCALQIGEDLSLPSQSEEHVVRCVSEGLANVAQHAQATAADVIVEERSSRLHVTIRDNGVGFDPAAIPTGHYGLVGLRERVRLANGQLKLSSRPQQGTTLYMEIPLEQAS